MAISIEDLVNWAVIFVLLGTCGLAVTSHFKLQDAQAALSEFQDGQWVCITEQCVESAYGDDWIADNCQGEPDNLECTLEIDDVKYRAPLSIINISRVKSCRRQECSTSIYIKTNLGVN